MDYEEILGVALGAHSPHRSIRTVCDPSSDEWNTFQLKISRIYIG